MKYLKVTNPVDTSLTLQFEGETYTIGANKSDSFPENIAKHWAFIYAFITLSADEPKVEKKADEVKVKIVKK